MIEPQVISSAFAILLPEAISSNLAIWDISAPIDLLPLPLKPADLYTNDDSVLLSRPDITYNLAELVILTPVDILTKVLNQVPFITNGNFEQLLQPESIIVKLENIVLKAPAIINAFEALRNPGKAGKSYTAKEAAKLDPQPALPGIGIKRCLHGLPKDQCELCKTQNRLTTVQNKPKKMPGARTVDVFDLLLPYLQPPIDILLTYPLLFPAGKRPFDYQIEGIKFLAERRAALLGDEMGLGKTIQAIVALQLLYRRGTARATLIVCPRSLLGTWERELTKWAPELYVMRVRGTPGERTRIWESPASVYLTTYETLRQDDGRVPGLATKFQVILLDEAQRIKNPTTVMAKAVHKIKAPVRWALSGTPVENKIEDLVAIFNYLMPGLFAYDLLIPDTVKRKIAPYFLRRRTADVHKQLPNKITNEIWLELTEAQQQTYTDAEDAGKTELGQPGTTRVHVFALINRLKQICNIDLSTKESCKVDYLVDQLDSVVESGQKALVLSHLPQVSLSQIEPRLRDFNTAIFDGQLSDSKRENLIDGFQNRDRPNVLLMSVQAGGTGLTLTAASHVFHFDHWWNPAVARQAEARAHRIGQTRTVFVHDIYTIGTIEQRIYQLLQQKQALFNLIVDDLSAEYVQNKFTDEDLFGLFNLKAPSASSEQQSRQKTDLASTRLPTVSSAIERVRHTIQTFPSPAQLHRLTPLEFEQFVARLYERMGFKTQLTSQSGDHGIDVIGRRNNEFGTETIIIQCKHMPNGVVGEPEVRDLLGARQEHRHARAILITSGAFSNAAKIMAQKHDIVLTDRRDIERLYQHYVSKTR